MRAICTVVLLTVSNIFMTFAWYGHLRFKSTPLLTVIIVSWSIALLEYCFQVPANRIGSYQFSTAQLKIIQEAITLIVFSIFTVVYLKEPLRWNYLLAFVLVFGAVVSVFAGKRSNESESCSQPIKISALTDKDPKSGQLKQIEKILRQQLAK